MMSTKRVLVFLLLTTTTFFTGAAVAYGSGGCPEPWSTTDGRGTEWTGTLWMVGKVVAEGHSSEPCGETGYPIDPDYLVTVNYFLSLENKRYGVKFFTGQAETNGFKLFYLLGDYCLGRFDQALQIWLSETVYPRLEGGPSGALVSTYNLDNNIFEDLGPGLDFNKFYWYQMQVNIIKY